MRFVIAAGGTGGHLFPGIAVGEVLVSRGHEVMLLISEKQIDSLATQGRSDFQIERLPGIGMPRLFSPALLPFLFRFSAGVSRCRSLFRDYKPEGVLGMGGFTSTAPILAGRLRKAPALIHESNAIPGKANRLNGRLANRVLLGFEACRKYFPPEKCEVTGTPVRATLAAQTISKEAALSSFGLETGRKTLLVMGGSQGAHGINQSVLGAVGELKSLPIQIIHLAGSADEPVLRDAYLAAGIPAHVAAFCHRMERAYSAADFLISRSGAASLTEIAWFGLPSILVPFPAAADDHQTWNARIFSDAGAAILFPEREITASSLAAKIRELLNDRALLPSMSERASQLASRDAAIRVADALLSSTKS